jgi:uncharacterized protein YkwD
MEKDYVEGLERDQNTTHFRPLPQVLHGSGQTNGSTPYEPPSGSI